MLSFLQRYLMADFVYSHELMVLAMAFYGAVQVKNTVNRLHWFHSLLLTIVVGNGGSALTPLWMNKSVNVMGDDYHLLCCIVCWAVVNYLPFGFFLGSTLPVKFVTLQLSQLFRTMTTVKHTALAFVVYSKDTYHPVRKIYPIPIFGPLFYGSLFGNMGGYLQKGFHSRLEQGGLPRHLVNSFVCSFIYHFFVHDETGPIGTFLHQIVDTLVGRNSGDDKEAFILLCISSFMQLDGLVQFYLECIANHDSTTLLVATSVAIMTNDDDDDDNINYHNSIQKEPKDLETTRINGESQRVIKKNDCVTEKPMETRQMNGESASHTNSIKRRKRGNWWRGRKLKEI